MTHVKKNVGVNLTEGKILKVLLLFAIPIVLTNLVQQLYSMVDLIIIGKFVGSIGTVGVSVGGEVADLITPIAMGFSMAGQIYIAQLYGANQNEKIKRSISTLFSLMFFISIVLMIAGIIFCVPILNIMNCPGEAMGQAEAYMIISCIGFPAIFGYNAIVGILRGMGESKRPLYFICVAAVVNIFMDVLLVVVFRMEAAGTAIATVLSQIGSFSAAFWFMAKNKEKFDLELNRNFFKIDRSILWVFIKLGIPQVVRSLCVRCSMMWVNSNINSYGLTVSATNSVGNKIQKFLEVFIQGVDTAAGAMVGQNLGARKYDRAKKVILNTLGCCLSVAAVCIFISLVFPTQVFSLFTNDAAVIELGKTYLSIICFHFFFSAITGTFQSMVTGSGFVELGFVLGILDGVVCRIGISLFFFTVLNAGYTSFWWGTALARVLTGLLCVGYFFSGKWKTRKLLTD